MFDLETAVTSLISAVIGGAIVAVVSHVLTRQREAEKRRTEKAIEYRIAAWRAIADQTGRALDTDAFEKALAEVILFGTEQEIQLVSKIMDEFVANHTSDTTQLLKILRRNIREELDLQKTSIEFRWLRVNLVNEPHGTGVIEGDDILSVRPTQSVPSPLVGEGQGGGSKCRT